jgi:hypothetical protein
VICSAACLASGSAGWLRAVPWIPSPPYPAQCSKNLRPCIIRPRRLSTSIRSCHSASGGSPRRTTSNRLGYCSDVLGRTRNVRHEASYDAWLRNQSQRRFSSAPVARPQEVQSRARRPLAGPFSCAWDESGQRTYGPAGSCDTAPHWIPAGRWPARPRPGRPGWCCTTGGRGRCSFAMSTGWLSLEAPRQICDDAPNNCRWRDSQGDAD